MIKALEGLLELSCFVVMSHRENLYGWDKHSPQSVSGSSVGSEVEAHAGSHVPARGQKRKASAMESVDDNEYFAGFERRPGAPRQRDIYEGNDYGPSVPPAGDARFAAARCALLPPTVSDGARKMLYELLTRPQYPSPAPGVHIYDVCHDTGLEYLEVKGYANELARLGKARMTEDPKWLPAGLSGGSSPSVNSRVHQSASTAPGPSGSQRISFSGFATLPSASRKKSRSVSKDRAPIGDENFAIMACAKLPSFISDEAKKMYYELITRPQDATYTGVCLVSIAQDTGLKLEKLLEYVQELKQIERAELIEGTCYYPTYLPDPR